MIKPKLKKLLVSYTENTCEQCKKICKLSELQIHRINRGLDYKNFRNNMVLCKACHQKIHWGEF